jgi:integrase
MILKMKYLSRERSGLFLYFRQIPADLREHYSGRILRRQSLQTHDSSIAAKEALRLARIDDQIWSALRNGASGIETARASIAEAVDPLILHHIIKLSAAPRQRRLSDALSEYLKKHEGKGPKFVADVTRVMRFAEDIIGNRPLAEIKRVDARRVLDSMCARGLKTASVKRYLGVLSAVFAVGLLEFEFDSKKPFSSLAIPNAGKDAKIIPSFTETELRQIATAAINQKVPEGLIATMQVETGCRVAEIAMLRASDIHLDEPIPFIDIIEHLAHGRRLKTPGSIRALPLLGVSLEAARIALAASRGSDWLFPRLGKGNPSSKVNPWLNKTLGGKRGSHSMRHSMESRLILAGTNQRLIDTILGHVTGGMGSVYFSGYGLADLAEALEKVKLR